MVSLRWCQIVKLFSDFVAPTEKLEREKDTTLSVTMQH